MQDKWPHDLVDYVLDSLAHDLLGRQVVEYDACLEVLLEIEELFEGIKEEHYFLRCLVGKFLCRCPEVFWVLQKLLKEAFYVLDAPDVAVLVLLLIGKWIVDELWTRLIADHHVCVGYVVSVIEAVLGVDKLGFVVSVALEFIPFLFLLFVLSSVTQARA